jgi:hypothetical protein
VGGERTTLHISGLGKLLRFIFIDVDIVIVIFNSSCICYACTCTCTRVCNSVGHHRC